MKKEIFLLVVLLLVALGLTGGAVYQYKNHQNVTDARVLRVTSERDSAQSQLKAHDNQNKLTSGTLTNQIQTLNTQKTALCAQLKTLKATNVVCQ